MTRRLELDAGQRQELVVVRDTAATAYLRERAAALLKVAAGQVAAAVARDGLLRPRHPDTVRDWLGRYLARGVAGLAIDRGRGRKPAFSPSAPGGECGQAGPAAGGPP